MDQASKWLTSPEKAKTYCDCALQKVRSKYPEPEDALKHVDSLATDPDFALCKKAALQ